MQYAKPWRLATCPLLISPVSGSMVMMALGWRPPAEVPTAMSDCIVSDSSGATLAFSRSRNILRAMSVNALMFSLSELLMPEDSGTNSRAPIPRLPMNERMSSGGDLLRAKAALYAPALKHLVAPGVGQRVGEKRRQLAVDLRFPVAHDGAMAGCRLDGGQERERVEASAKGKRGCTRKTKRLSLCPGTSGRPPCPRA